MKEGNTEDRVQEFLDQRNKEEEVNALINETEETRKELNLIKETDKQLKSIELSNPSEGFSNRVMTKLEEASIPRGVTKQGLIIVLGVLMVLLISAFFINSVNPGIITIPEDVSVVGRNFSLDGVGQLLNTGFIMKGLMFVAMLLAMLILDRALLKPFFDRRKGLA